MRTPNWIRSLRRRLTSAPGRRSRAPAPRLGVEQLDDRSLPSVAFGGAFAIGNGGVSPRDIATDGVGNTYVCGLFGGTTDFDPTHTNSSAVLTAVTPSGQDGFVAEYDAAGGFVRVVSFTASPKGIAVTPSGDAILVTGSFGGTVDFDPAHASTQTVVTSAGEADGFVARMDGVGHFQWARRWGDVYDIDTGSGVAFDASGNAYVAGQVNHTPGSFNNNIDAYVARFGPTGTPAGVWQFGSDSITTAAAVAVDPGGNILVGGSFYGTVDFDPGQGKYNLTSGGRSVQPSEAGYVMELFSNGSFAWASHFQANQWAGSRVTDIALVPASLGGGVYAVGGYSGTVDFDPAKNGTYRLGGGGAFAVRLNAQGQLGTTGWVRTFPGDNGYGVYAAVDAGGNLYLTGSFQGTVDLDPGTGVFTRTSAGGEDVYVVKLNPSGQFQWGATMGGTGLDRPQGIAVDGSGTVYLTGLFVGPADFDPAPGTTYILNGAYTTMFWERLTQN